MTATFEGFPPEALTFLRRLKRNNHREWFLKNKPIYDEKVKAPMVELVLGLGREMKKFAPEMQTDPARAIYRIYRDVRFSPNKTPYKTHISAIFHPRGRPKHDGAGLYFHVSTSEVEIAGGVYMPERDTLLAIRHHIAGHHRQLRAILEAPEFRRLFGEPWGEKLSRAPKGFAPDHPAAELLRYKQLLADVAHPPDLAATPRLFPTLVECFRAMMPLVRFLNAPLKERPPQAGGLG